MTVYNWDESLLRALAVLQVQLQFLDQQTEQFTELADMQAHRRIKSDLTEYIAAHSHAGAVPTDPLAELVPRLHNLVSFFEDSATLQRTLVSSHQRFFQEEFSAISLSDVHNGQGELNEATAKLPASLKNLAIQLSALDWSGDGADNDIHPELILCSQGLGIDLSIEAKARREFRAMALGGGRLYRQVQGHFDSVRSRLEGLVHLHAKHRDALRLAFAEVKRGNPLSAEHMLSSAGLKQESPRGFSDLDYSKVTTNIASLKGVSDQMNVFAQDLPVTCRTILNHFEAHCAKRNRVSSCDQAKRQLATLRSTLELHLTEAAALPGSELEKKCRPNLEAVKPVLANAETTLDRLAVNGARARRRFLFTSVIIIGIAGLIVLGWEVSEFRKRADIEAKLAVERDAADVKANVERVAAIEAQATAERLEAEVKAQSEHVAAAAKANTERIAAGEAQATAERIAAAAKVQAEHDAAETKANTERATAFAAELPRRIAEAEAALANAKIQFQKQEAEIIGVKKTKNKLITDIAEQITAIKRELDEAGGNDSAEQHYGTLLIQLLDSLRGKEVFSGDGKVPRATDAFGILLHAPKSQISTTSNGYEDFNNVKNYYFVSDFAFVNIPARDQYTWTERKKIDKIIGEYLARAAGYKARRLTLIDRLHNEEAANAKARAELESIANAESEARVSVNRAQELLDALLPKSTTAENPEEVK